MFSLYTGNIPSWAPSPPAEGGGFPYILAMTLFHFPLILATVLVWDLRK